MIDMQLSDLTNFDSSAPDRHGKEQPPILGELARIKGLSAAGISGYHAVWVGHEWQAYVGQGTVIIDPSEIIRDEVCQWTYGTNEGERENTSPRPR
jgi:hypothetical protein